MGSSRSAHILLLLAMLLSGFVTSNASDAIAPSLRKAIDDAVEKEMARQQAVGVAIGVIQDGEVAYTACYGWASSLVRMIFPDCDSTSDPLLHQMSLQEIKRASPATFRAAGSDRAGDRDGFLI